MRLSDIRVLYSALGTTNPVERGKWVIGACPFARFRHSSGTDNNPSFGITKNPKGVSRFHCFSCNSSGDIMDLGLELGMLYRKLEDKPDLPSIMKICAGELDEAEILGVDIPEYEIYKSEPKVDYDFPEYWLDKYPSVLDCFNPQPRNYLRGRGVPKRIAALLDIRWDDSRGRVVFPYYNDEGLLCGANGRAIHDSNPLRYYQYSYEGHTNLHLWYGEDRVNFDKPLVVTESVFDVASILRVYGNVIAPFSCSFSKDKALRIGDASEIITVFDAGSGGDIARENMTKYLGSRVVAQYIPKSDAGDMSKGELVDMLGDCLELIP